MFDSFQSYVTKQREKGAEPTTNYHFHGTTMNCNLLACDSVCNDRLCGVCGISQRGFDPELIGTNIPRFMRFGRGFYLAPNSSKCHDYTQGTNAVGLRAQILCLVASGTKFETRSDHTNFSTPPEHYDSVYGRSGGTLNYEEVVVYKSEAILPEFIVVYKRDSVHKIAK